MLKLPDDPTSPIRLADWLELTAILSSDGNASRGDLERTLRRASLSEMRDDLAVEQKLLEVFEEIEQRWKAAASAYPFEVDYGTLQTKSTWHQFPAYAFCLCLSYFGSPTLQPRKLFELVSGAAAKAFVYGNAVDFGSPRHVLSAAFPDAVSQLCALIGEGDRYAGLPTLGQKDAKLDLVAWRDFPDRNPSKLLMLGQCASGSDWEGKIRELNPRAFFANWTRETPASPLISSLFIPHRIERKKWKSIARNSDGIVFDRCRIAYLAHGANFDFDPCINWVEELLHAIQ
jgi:hypothetical protein